MIETIVDRLVIRDDDPRHVDESGSWMKIRGVTVAIAPAIASLGILSAIDAPELITMTVPLVLVLLGVKAVAGPINERIDELEQSDNISNSDQ